MSQGASTRRRVSHALKRVGELSELSTTVWGSTDGIAEKDSEKIDHLVVAETATSKAHLLAKAFQHLLVT